ncbi:hypothetical protein ACHAXH_007337, partial [Discostella pseudostelligera]
PTCAHNDIFCVSSKQPPTLIHGLETLYKLESWSTSPKNAKPTAPAVNAASTKSTRSLNTNPARPRTLPKANAVTIPSRWDLVDRPSPSFTRRPRRLVRLYCDWNVRSVRRRNI